MNQRQKELERAVDKHRGLTESFGRMGDIAESYRQLTARQAAERALETYCRFIMNRTQENGIDADGAYVAYRDVAGLCLK